MAKLTDLPDEVLALVFRNFLHSSFTDHSYLCKWYPDEIEVANRANLARLALVSKALYELAMPLLFEELVDEEDATSLVQDESSWRIALRYAHFTLRVNFMIGSYTAALPWSSVPELLSKCTQLMHLKCYIDQESDSPGAQLTFLVGIARDLELQSLSIRCDLFTSPTALQQLSTVDSLVGLEIDTEVGGEYQAPSIKLDRLKALKISGGWPYSMTRACLSLASSTTLQEASLELAAESEQHSPICPVFGLENWKRLEKLEITICQNADIRQMIDLSSFPALRHLIITPGSDIIEYFPLLSAIPATLCNLDLRDMVTKELVDVLRLAQQTNGLGEGLRHLTMDLPGVTRAEVLASLGEAEFLLLAERAVIALQSRGVALKPANLMEVLAEMFTDSD